jgi:hypothetical protein
MEIPKVFISYSHDTQQHKKWVLELAIRLRNNGIDAVIDQFELKAGDDIPHFMETNLASSNKILMICTNKYVDKANRGEGGVGYEKMIITSNLMKGINENKIIPIIRQVASSNVPTFLKSKLYINFSTDDDFEFVYDELVRTIHNSPLFEKPPVGNHPFKQVEKVKLDGDIELLHKVIKAIKEEYADFDQIYTTNIAYRLGISRALVDVAIIKLIENGYASWFIKNKQVELTDKGKFYAYENKLL